MKLNNWFITISHNDGYYEVTKWENPKSQNETLRNAKVKEDYIFEIIYTHGFLSYEKKCEIDNDKNSLLHYNKALQYSIGYIDEKGSSTKKGNPTITIYPSPEPALSMAYPSNCDSEHKTLLNLIEKSQDNAIETDHAFYTTIKITGNDCFEKFLDLAVAAYEKDHENIAGKGGKE